MSEEIVFEPDTTEIETYDLHIENTGNLRFLVFTDLHIGQTNSTSEETPKIFEKIVEAVRIAAPTHIFILGDIVHLKLYHIPTSWTDFYKMLETLNIPIHLIPGNHDRKVFMHSFVKMIYTENNVHLHNVELLRVFVSGYKYPIVFGHDVKNDKKAHGNKAVRAWIDMLRRTFHEYIPDESLLVLGHVHSYIKTVDKLSYTLKPFSLSLNSFQYVVITPGEEDHFNFAPSKIKP